MNHCLKETKTKKKTGIPKSKPIIDGFSNLVEYNRDRSTTILYQYNSILLFVIIHIIHNTDTVYECND